MAVQALYRKWRPQTFDEVVGQGHVVSTLRQALASGRVHHAYLFAGPRGTGKTTMARLLAKAVNCLAPEEQRPCNECPLCQAVNEGRLLDLIEIDAASNTGVDDVRELRERVGFRPNEGRYKVYVIDEVHMLSTSAFNALLKTLEEPPPHAIFVLATTEPHKIPATVVSRCQRFNFRRIPVSEVVARLTWMVEQEHLSADVEALKIIARQATGSMRDAESLLDQMSSYGETGISVQEVRTTLGTGAGESILRLTDALINGDLALGLETIHTAVDEGTDPRQFARQMVEHLRGLLLLRLETDVNLVQLSEDWRSRMQEQAGAFSPHGLARIVRSVNQAAVDAKGGGQPQLPLELAFIESTLPDETDAAPSHSPNASDPPRPKSSSPRRSKSSSSTPPRTKEPADRSALSVSDAPSATGVREVDADYVESSSDTSHAPEAKTDVSWTLEELWGRWQDVLESLRLRKHNLPLEALMRSCKPMSIEGEVIVLGFDYDLHRSRVEEDQNRQDVEDVLSELTGRRCRVRCVLSQAQQGPTAKAPISQASLSRAEGDTAASTIDTENMAEDLVVRTAIEDLGAQIV